MQCPIRRGRSLAMPTRRRHESEKERRVMMRQHTQPDQETRTNQAVDLDAALRRYLADPTASWGLGTFGAVAEFHRTADEPVSIDTDATLEVVTTRGALRI